MTHNPRMKWIALGIAFVVGLLMGAFIHRAGDSEVSQQQMFIFIVVAFAVIIGASVVWWRSLDELAREAHKSAWFWGGSVGLGLAAIPMVIITQMAARGAIELDQFSGTAGFLLGFSGGAGVPILTTLAGYFIAWGIFWWQKR